MWGLWQPLFPTSATGTDWHQRATGTIHALHLGGVLSPLLQRLSAFSEFLARSNNRHGHELCSLHFRSHFATRKRCPLVVFTSCRQHFITDVRAGFRTQASGTLALVLSYLVESGIREIVTAPRKSRKMEDCVDL